MKKIVSFFKKYAWVWIIVIVLVAIIGDAYLTRKIDTPSPSPTPTPRSSSYKNIVPGVSTEEELNKILGTPLKTTINGTEKTDEYKATTGLRRHIAIIQRGKVVFIKEVVTTKDTSKASDIIAVYGTAPNILYSKYPNATFDLYVYPANGIAYLGHKDGGLLEIWYFQPTTLDDFSSTWGKDYSQTKPTEITY
ncbi:MAG: hypothetical protein HYV90_01145 [Candidatus Woesebacteria bacterium]|nr:MAG: hypothetical protein HYV90_01145 [Candidatus Woesebacteria bacterium]